MILFIWSYKIGKIKLCCLGMHYIVGKHLKEERESSSQISRWWVPLGVRGRREVWLEAFKRAFGALVIFSFFTWMDLIYYYLLNFTYMFYETFCRFQNKAKEGNGQFYQMLTQGRVIWGLRLEHWVKQSGDSWWIQRIVSAECVGQWSDWNGLKWEERSWRLCANTIQRKFCVKRIIVVTGGNTESFTLNI